MRGFYNSGITTGHACAQVAYKCITSPTDYPINDGSFRSLKTIVPPGRVISAVRPAPMRWWMTYPMTIVDTIFKALAPAIPDRVIAGHHADLLASAFHGINTAASEFFIGSFGPLGGGWGAKLTEDGVSGTVCINDGDTHNSPNEQAEFEVSDRGRALRAGAGFRRRRPPPRRPRGRARGARAHQHHGQQPDRPRALPARGASRAASTAPATRSRSASAAQWKTDFPNAKVLVAQLKPGDAFSIRSGGGGGYGEPLERPVEQVREDVRQGYVSVTAAAELYGVVLDAETFEIDDGGDRDAAGEAARRWRRGRKVGVRATNRRTSSYSLVKQPTLRRPGHFRFSGAGRALSPFSVSLADEGYGAPGGAGRLGERPADRGAVRHAPWRRRVHPNDVGVRRLPALHRGASAGPRSPAPRRRSRPAASVDEAHDGLD